MAIRATPTTHASTCLAEFCMHNLGGSGARDETRDGLAHHMHSYLASLVQKGWGEVANCGGEGGGREDGREGGGGEGGGKGGGGEGSGYGNLVQSHARSQSVLGVAFDLPEIALRRPLVIGTNHMVDRPSSSSVTAGYAQRSKWVTRPQVSAGSASMSE
eukprot:CAMPEP_0181188694 /NCGR_PEP_ID=MMETSP1096-20121128/11259_1 /TAXON_ID=156174 ORGANISM="Chrysochromulina ericina, Strain CCMP281" /NCGR_SAMPLE_ID=MMETSP1096 /ASSEMBLY_ACC=CAM_ASM_000453 /LENGTH=158 /DNA_ID=CAMNT_0023277785 /DNA_START=637 /DNA_END=1116 /DNA_ORIENTATION=-